jgi:hypothetical protein
MKFISTNYNSSKIFLIDASGALVSIILLFILYLFEDYFGMPKNIISVFIGIAAILFLYSTIIYLLSPKTWRTYLTVVAMLNICYSVFTIYHVFLCFEKLTLYGKLYFVGEVLVIIVLSFYELKIATETKVINN